mmetsp:Transcript_60328/g.168550  ORF Transcript_60328/g.168550 Transcript_60328/m.168550 type:complete len:254 (+) Transcript_60328:953-1714(+)
MQLQEPSPDVVEHRKRHGEHTRKALALEERNEVQQGRQGKPCAEQCHPHVREVHARVDMVCLQMPEPRPRHRQDREVGSALLDQREPWQPQATHARDEGAEVFVRLVSLEIHARKGHCHEVHALAIIELDILLDMPHEYAADHVAPGLHQAVVRVGARQVAVKLADRLRTIGRPSICRCCFAPNARVTRGSAGPHTNVTGSMRHGFGNALRIRGHSGAPSGPSDCDWVRQWQREAFGMGPRPGPEHGLHRALR